MPQKGAGAGVGGEQCPEAAMGQSQSESLSQYHGSVVRLWASHVISLGVEQKAHSPLVASKGKPEDVGKGHKCGRCWDM